MTTTTVQARRLRQYLLEHGASTIHEAQGRFEYPFVTPTAHIVPGFDDDAEVPERSSTGRYAQMYDWDACLFAQTFARHGRDIRLDVIRNFLSMQQRDGYISRTASPNRIWDTGDNCKPFLCQTMLSIENTPVETAREIVGKLRDWLDYYNRHHRRGILFAWDDVLESGVDSNLALLAPRVASKDRNFNPGDYREHEILAIDLSSYLSAEFKALAALLDRSGQAKRVGDACESADWRRLANDILSHIETLMWSDKFGMYLNFDTATSSQIEVLSWTGLVPAFLGVASKDRTETIIERHLLNPRSFWLAHGIPSMSKESNLFNNAPRGLYGQVVVSNWQGPVWILPNAWAISLLLKMKMEREATELALRVTNTLLNGIERQGTTFENYHALTGEGLWSPDFISWNIMCLDFLSLLE